MRRRFSYSIGFLCAAALLSTGYYISYDASSEGNTEYSIEADTSSAPRYVLRVSEGHVCAYRTEDGSLYESTSIEARTLPRSIQEALADGIYLKSEVELYSFLESYTS